MLDLVQTSRYRHIELSPPQYRDGDCLFSHNPLRTYHNQRNQPQTYFYEIRPGTNNIVYVSFDFSDFFVCFYQRV